MLFHPFIFLFISLLIISKHWSHSIEKKNVYIFFLSRLLLVWLTLAPSCSHPKSLASLALRGHLYSKLSVFGQTNHLLSRVYTLPCRHIQLFVWVFAAINVWSLFSLGFCDTGPCIDMPLVILSSHSYNCYHKISKELSFYCVVSSEDLGGEQFHLPVFIDRHFYTSQHHNPASLPVLHYGRKSFSFSNSRQITLTLPFSSFLQYSINSGFP